jgi:nucleoside-diphosphate-sugar epimerase
MVSSSSQFPILGQAYFLVGGAGFIGSHFTDALLGNRDVRQVTIYDNFSSGRKWHYEHHADDRRLRVICGDVTDSKRLMHAMLGHDVVIHLASNPDIARATTEPAIDFEQGTSLTHFVVEAMRASDTKRILYASGSGVYGATPTHLYLRCKQAGRRGSDQFLLPHVWIERGRFSLWESSRSTPKARRGR